MKDKVKQVFYDTCESYIKDYSLKHAYKNMYNEELGKTNIDHIQITNNMYYKDHVQLFGVDFNYENGKSYIVVHYDLLKRGERMTPLKIRNFNHKLQKLRDLQNQKIISKSINLFYNGLKINSDEFYIAIFDDYFVLQIPDTCTNFANAYIIIHDYMFEKTVYGEGTIVIDELLNIPSQYGNCTPLVYRNNTLQTNYSIRLSTNGSTIISFTNYPNSNDIIEVVFMLDGMIRLDDHYVDNYALSLMDYYNTLNYPVPENNILIFNEDGKYLEFSLTSIDTLIYNAGTRNAQHLTVIVNYNNHSINDAKYKDRFLDYFNEHKTEVGLPTSYLPEYMKYFNLFTEEISLDKFFKENTNKEFIESDLDGKMYSFYVSTLNRIFAHDYEQMSIFYSLLLDNINEEYRFMLEDTHIVYDLSSPMDCFYTKTNSNCTINFKYEMCRFKILNTGKNIIEVLLDGKLYCNDLFTEMADDNYMYVYINTIYLSDVKDILIRKYNTIRDKSAYIKYTFYDHKEFTKQDPCTFIIKDAKTKYQLINSKEEEPYIRLYFFNDTDKKMCSLSLDDIIYDEEKDELTIYKGNDYINEYTINSLEFYIVNINYVKSNYRILTSDHDNDSTHAVFSNLCLDTSEKFMDIDNILVYKNGFMLPKEYYTLERVYDTSNNPCINLTLNNIQYCEGEEIDFVYIPLIPFQYFTANNQNIENSNIIQTHLCKYYIPNDKLIKNNMYSGSDYSYMQIFDVITKEIDANIIFDDSQYNMIKSVLNDGTIELDANTNDLDTDIEIDANNINDTNYEVSKYENIYYKPTFLLKSDSIYQKVYINGRLINYKNPLVSKYDQICSRGFLLQNTNSIRHLVILMLQNDSLLKQLSQFINEMPLLFDTTYETSYQKYLVDQYKYYNCVDNDYDIVKKYESLLHGQFSILFDNLTKEIDANNIFKADEYDFIKSIVSNGTVPIDANTNKLDENIEIDSNI